MEDKEPSSGTMNKQPIPESPIPPTVTLQEKSPLSSQSKKIPSASNNRSPSKQKKSPPKKRGRPPKGTKKGPNENQVNKPKRKYNKTKKENGGTIIDITETTPAEEKNDAPTTTTTQPRSKRTRVPTKRLLEHLSFTTDTPTKTKKKKRGRPPKKKDVFTFKDIMPMDPVSSDGGICSSGNSSYDGCENGDDDDEDDIICCVCHCAVDYSDPSMFEPSNGKINDVDSGAVIEEENRKSAENLNGNEKNASNDGILDVEASKEKKNKNDNAETERKEPLLPRSLYDPQNAILLCDTPGCNRAYHQRCHFVPVFVIPRGDWHCMICRYGQFLRSSGLSSSSSKADGVSRRGRPPKQSVATVDEENGAHVFHQSDLIRIFQSKPYEAVLREKKEKEEEEEEQNRSQAPFTVEKGDKMMNSISLPQQQPLESVQVPSITVIKDVALNGNVIEGGTCSNKEVSNSTDSTIMVKEGPLSQAGKSAPCPPNMGNIKKAVDIITAIGSNIKSPLKHVGTCEMSNNPHQNLESLQKPLPIEAPVKSKIQTPLTSSLPALITSQQPLPESSDNINTIHKQEIINSHNALILPSRPQIPLDKLEKEFECSTSTLKSSLLHRELTIRIKSTINQCLARIRLSQDTLRAHTETDRSRKSLLATYEKTHRLPQEIVQSLSIMAKGKLKIRETLESLDRFIKGYDDAGVLIKWLCSKEEKRGNDDGFKKDTALFVEKYPSWFSTDVLSHRRVVPRICSHSDPDNNSAHIQEDKTRNIDEKGTADEFPIKDGSDDDDDDDDMIETDDLACAVCFSGTSSDSNDLLLCDGEGCNRCFHMNCITPHVTKEELGDDDDSWFCPYCSNLAILVHYAQVEYLGDEWEERLRRKEQYKRHHHHEEDENNDDNESTSSWEKATDVFPEAEYENSVAAKWSNGIRDHETDVLLSSFLGCSLSTNIPAGADENSTSISILDEVDDDEEEDEDYNDDDNNEKGDSNPSAESGSDDDDDTSLEDISSIESGIDKSELDALSSCSSSDSGDNADEDENDSSTKQQKTRRSKRSRGRSYPLAKKTISSSKEQKDAPPADVGALDEANIVVGKRNRTKVDYRRLNDAMFGDVSATEAAILFGDEDDYHYDGDSSETKSCRRQKNLPGVEEEFDVTKKRGKAVPLRKSVTPRKRGRPNKKMKIDATTVSGNINEVESSFPPKVRKT